MHNVEGDIQKLDAQTYRILMMEANEQDVLGDLRERIVAVLEGMLANDKSLGGIKDTQFMLQVKGIREFFI